jgi:hypothetical protein
VRVLDLRRQAERAPGPAADAGQQHLRRGGRQLRPARDPLEQRREAAVGCACQLAQPGQEGRAPADQ